MMKKSIIITIIFVLQILAPTFASAQTNPPTNSGDWTIPVNDVTYYNNSQALVQGDVIVYGTLIVQDSNIYLWGANNGDREVVIHNGGQLIMTNSVIASYAGSCIGVLVDTGSTIVVESSRFENICVMDLESKNVHFNDTYFEKSSVDINLQEYNSVYDPSSGTTTYEANYTFSNLTFSNNSASYNSNNLRLLHINSASVIISSKLLFSNITMLVNSAGSVNSAAVEFDTTQFKRVEFNGLNITTSYSPYTSRQISADQSLIHIYQISSNILEFRNFSLHDAPNHMGISVFSGGNSGELILDNGSIQRLAYNAATSTTSYPFYHISNTYAYVIKAQRNPLTMKNVVISDNIVGSYSTTSTSSYLGYQKVCAAIYLYANNQVSMDNVTITNNCNFEYYNSNAQVTQSDIGYCPTNSGYTAQLDFNHVYCNSWNFVAIWNDHNWQDGSSTGKFIISNSTIKDNNRLLHMYNSSSGSYWEYRAAHLSSVGIISESPLHISNSIIQNNSNAQIIKLSTSGISDYRYASQISNYEIVQSTSSSSYSYINNSLIDLPTCRTQSIGSHSSYAYSYCETVRMYDGTLNFVNSTISLSDLSVIGGEAIVYFNLDVRVTDPDGQWTPNANVSVVENGFWSLGTQSTGSSGKLTRFIAKHFSKSPTQYYNYTPHQISVTMTNYSNSTSINVTQYTSVIVYDPTPDAFPGDITQDFDTDGDGYGDNISGNNPDHFPYDSSQWNDTDGDGWGDNQTGNNPDRLPNDNTQWNDTDGDGYGDNQSGNNPDRLPNDNTQWNDADGDGYGDNQNGNNPDRFTSDSTQWSDADGDGYGDNQSGNNPDRFPSDNTQWNDSDGDGYGDNANGNNPDAFPLDSTQYFDGDNDGYGDNQSGNNPDPYLNDSDNDGYNNSVDTFPWNPTQHEDLDGDGLGDNTSGTAADPYPNDTDNDGSNNSVDPFPLDPTQWEDNDQDGYGDNQSGNNPDPYLDDSDNDGVNNSNDDFPYNPTQTTDSDGDGWGDNQSGYPADAFPNEPSQWQDADGDGHGDNANGVNGDAFPNNPTQWQDSDGDGHGDNPNGSLPDQFPYDASQWLDADGDGYGDNYSWIINLTTGLRQQNGDAFPLDSTQWSDIDGDGFGDNLNGSNYDEYPYDSTQWQDADNDGFPDNYSYTVNSTTGLRENQIGDAFPNDPTQGSDVDGDGYGDNQSGNNADAFPYDPTQWADADNDGLGDNPNGTNPDPTPGDTDNDGVPDYLDAFPFEPTQWSDSDGDGFGDNWGATTWTSLRPSGLPGMFIQNAVLVDYFPLVAAAVNDTDFDGFPDDWGVQDTGSNRADLILDSCPTIYGNATSAGPGCPDSDGDGTADQDDAFPIDPTQWDDTDGDGYGDNLNGSFPDHFPNDNTQWADVDGDGYGDNQSGNNSDTFPNDVTQWSDTDGDGYGDNEFGLNADQFPDDATQWADADGDGLGDNPDGNNPDPYVGDSDNDAYPNEQDDCPLIAGNSTYDVQGCVDSDGDGVSDAADLWPNDPSRSIDTDGDGVNDPSDAFPNDPTQWADADNDGLGDNPNGNNPDPYLDDSDNDGVLNQNDPFPTDSSQWEDLDGDGLGDNADGNNSDPSPNDTDNDGVQNPSDLYPLDSTQWADSDGDGWGDNSFGIDGDQFPNDPTQCCDTDGDGWGDNPDGNMPDAFPLDPSQWMDADNDGLGDNPNGTNPDPSPGDTDNDGVKNNADYFPNDPTKALDTDGDGISDNDENFILARIPETSTSLMLSLVLIVAIGAGAIGFLAGGRRFQPQYDNNHSFSSSDFNDEDEGTI